MLIEPLSKLLLRQDTQTVGQKFWSDPLFFLQSHLEDSIASSTFIKIEYNWNRYEKAQWHGLKN